MTGAVGVPAPQVPVYLLRVLDSDGSPVGTCLQVAAGVLVTAWHVLERAGATVEGARVAVEPLAGGPAAEAVVVRLDQPHDLAVLSCELALRESAGGLAATDQVAAQAP
jgi:hypothetical protein